MITPDAIYELEKLIDNNSLADVVNELSKIASQKACHLKENWQDENLARVWRADSDLLEKTAGKLAN